jgi:hypothetical protein
MAQIDPVPDALYILKLPECHHTFTSIDEIRRFLNALTETGDAISKAETKNARQRNASRALNVAHNRALRRLRNVTAERDRLKVFLIECGISRENIMEILNQKKSLVDSADFMASRALWVIYRIVTRIKPRDAARLCMVLGACEEAILTMGHALKITPHRQDEGADLMVMNADPSEYSLHVALTLQEGQIKIEPSLIEPSLSSPAG